jgi:hypothetical protein
VLVGGRRSDYEPLATLKGELPKRMVGVLLLGRIAVVVMKELQNLPKPRNKGQVIRNGRIGLEERNQTRSFMRRSRSETSSAAYRSSPNIHIQQNPFSCSENLQDDSLRLYRMHDLLTRNQLL